MRTTEQHIAQVRYGLGVPGVGGGPGSRKALKHALRADLGRMPRAFEGLPDSATLVVEQVQVRGASDWDEARREYRERARDRAAAELIARLGAARETRGAFSERLALFFANWFTVSAVRKEVAALVGPFEREAIRPNLSGTFGDLVVATTLHPAMLGYLDNVRSIGPDSPAGLRRDVGLNENLAREVLELHTLGVDGGYDQGDVEAFARVLTGWSVDRETGEPAFYERRHEPGTNTILGQRFPDHGADTAREVLRFLASHPSTARHVARRLVAQVLGDTPPAHAIATVEGVFADSGGDLPRTFAALVDLDAVWDGPLRAKVRTPQEWLLAAVLAADAAPDDGKLVFGALLRMGQPWGLAPSPAGWPEDDAGWLAPDAFVARLEIAEKVGRQVAGLIPDPVAWADLVLGPSMMPETRSVLPRLDPRRAVALVLGSPEFQRR